MTRPTPGNRHVTLVLVAVLALVLGGVAGTWARDRVVDPTAPPGLLDADVAFARSVLGAHRDAVLLTSLLPRDAAPDVRHAADEVMASQWRTAGQATGWLEASGLTDPDALPEFGHDHGAAPLAQPGTGPVSPNLGASDLEGFRGLSGAALEVAYLRTMIRHQERSVSLVADAVGGLSAPAVRRAAGAMTGDRVEAVELLAGTLVARGLEPRTAG